MRIDIQAKGQTLPKNLETWLQKKLKKFERMDATASAQVSLRRNQAKGPVEADIRLRTQWGSIQSKYRAYDEKTALSRVLTKIEEQFRRFKEKSTVERRRMTSEALQTMEEQHLQEEADVRLRFRPLRSFPLMTLEEAITQVRQNGVQWIVFRDLDNQEQVTLLYPEDERTLNVVRFGVS